MSKTLKNHIEAEKIVNKIGLGKSTYILLGKLIIGGLFLMIAWNTVVPTIFALQGLTYLQSVALYFLLSLIKN